MLFSKKTYEGERQADETMKYGTLGAAIADLKRRSEAAYDVLRNVSAIADLVPADPVTNGHAKSKVRP